MGTTAEYGQEQVRLELPLETTMANGDMVLSRDEQHELRRLLVELYFPAKAHGPVPMQRDYWPEVLALQEKWRKRLDLTEEEVRQIADADYNRRTYG
jgi:hypothetical protein